MTEIFSVVAAFGTNADAEGAVQKLERSGLPKCVMSIENRVSPINQRTPNSYHVDSSMGSWAITGALLGGLLGFLINGDRFQHKKEDVLVIDPLLCCIGFAVKGAWVFAGASLISLGMNGEITRMLLMHDEPTLSVDPYLLVVHGAPAAVTLASEVLRTC
jgi:hypothetical protein